MIHYQENTAPHHHILTTHQITDTIINTNNDYASQGTDIIKKTQYQHDGFLRNLLARTIMKPHSQQGQKHT